MEDLAQYGIRQLRNGLTLDEIKSTFPWILDAKLDGAVIGKNSGRGYIQFYGGTWQDGTWEFGHWWGGTWSNGTWNDGVWHDGIWRNGVWKSGKFAGGHWYNGIFEGGMWDGPAIWHNGIFKGGTWYQGDWQNWQGGSWEGGRLYDHNFGVLQGPPHDPYADKHYTKRGESMSSLKHAEIRGVLKQMSESLMMILPRQVMQRDMKTEVDGGVELSTGNKELDVFFGRTVSSIAVTKDRTEGKVFELKISFEDGTHLVVHPEFESANDEYPGASWLEVDIQ